MQKASQLPDAPKPHEGASDWATIHFPPPPILTLSRLIIRPYHINDAPEVTRISNNIKISRWMTNRFPYPCTLDDTIAFINLTRPGPGPDAKAKMAYLICERREGTPIGGITINPGQDLYTRSCELGYFISEEHWGKGYATEAAKGMVDYVFGLADGLDGEMVWRVGANVSSGNPASERVLLKAGFVHEGVMRDKIWKLGELRSLANFSVLKDEWEERKKSAS
jgi:ribosomal-protein-alanine N-acetyltransferase